MCSKQVTRLVDWKEFATKIQGKKYEFPAKSVNWFPGHMVKGLREMQHTLLKTDCVIEVHDARIPLSGRNISFKNSITGNRPHILVLNKQDLAFGKPKQKQKSSEIDLQKLEIKTEIMKRETNLSDVLFCSCTNLNSGLKSILPRAIALIEGSDRYHRASRPDSNVMIIGIPNVGKSSLINHIRKGNLNITNNALRVGNKPGVTRTLENKVKVSQDPLVYLLDTPGIMMPNIKDMHVGMKLAACGTLRDDAVGEINIVDYLLFHLNQVGNFSYVDYMKLNDHGPQEHTKVMLARSAHALGYMQNKKDLATGCLMKVPDYDRAATRFIKGFRDGQFGSFILDTEQLLSKL